MAEEPRNEQEENPFAEYEKILQRNQDDAIDKWDKWVLGLASGAMGVSFAFVKDIVKPENMVYVGLLFWAWMCWIISIVFVLWSFYSSYCANRKAIKQLRAQDIYLEKPGGIWDWVTRNVLNPGSGVFFVAGLILVCFFAYYNLANAAQEKPVQPKPSDMLQHLK